MKINNVDFEKLSYEKSFRSDYDFHKYYQNHLLEYYIFYDLFCFPETKIISEEQLYCDFKYCEIGNVDKNGNITPVVLNFNERSLINENYYKKIEKGDIIAAEKGDILISKVRPNLKKFVLIDEDMEDVYFTSAFIRIKPKKIPEILYHCLRTIFYENLIAVSRQGKGYPTINETDIKEVRFNKTIIDQLIDNKDAIEKKISETLKTAKKLSLELRSLQEIIDSAFQKKFVFDYKKFEKLKEEKNYHLEQQDFGNNLDLRFSAKYHRPAGAFVKKQLAGTTDKKIKHFLAAPIVLGASISPEDFDERGEAYYVSMATIKTLEIELDETQLVSDSFYQAKKDKTLEKGDIVMARSGVAIGKTAIVKEDFKGIFADFTMRIRFDSQKYNPMFGYYYLRSKYFQYLIELYKKGLQNQNIFPIVMQEFPAPDLLPEEQQKIVDEIEREIGKQKGLYSKIAELRSQINNIIEETVCK